MISGTVLQESFEHELMMNKPKLNCTCLIPKLFFIASIKVLHKFIFISLVNSHVLAMHDAMRIFKGESIYLFIYSIIYLHIYLFIYSYIYLLIYLFIPFFNV